MYESNLAKLPAVEGSGFLERAPLTRAIPPTYRSDMLYEPFHYDVGRSNSGDRITVPKGFVTNYASTPRLLWAIFPPRGRWSSATIIHDYLYQNNGRSRKECDRIFLEAMKVAGVGWFARNAMYRGVRAGGWVPWRKYRIADKGGVS